MKVVKIRRRNPFKQGQQVRFDWCDNEACSCHRLHIVPGIIGTIGQRIGKTVLVDFGDRHEGLMALQTGFRIATITDHLKRIDKEQKA